MRREAGEEVQWWSGPPRPPFSLDAQHRASPFRFGTSSSLVTGYA